MWQTYFFRWQNLKKQIGKCSKNICATQSNQIEHFMLLISRVLLMTWKNLTSLVKSWSAKIGISVLLGSELSSSLREWIWPKHKKFCGQVDFEGLLALPNDSVEPCKLWLAGRWLHCLWWWHLQCSNDTPKVWFINLYKVIVYRLIVYSQLFIVRRLKFIGASTMWTRQALWLFVSTAFLAPWTQTDSTGWAFRKPTIQILAQTRYENLNLDPDRFHRLSQPWSNQYPLEKQQFKWKWFGTNYVQLPSWLAFLFIRFLSC